MLEKSAQWASRASRVLAQGQTGTNSKRPSQFIEGVYPSHLVRGQGCYVWDVDGNRYIDFIGGLGSIILGYAHPKVNDAIKRQLNDGVSFSLPHRLEVEVAELISSIIPCAEKIRFLKTGSEACSAAVRIARAYTGNGHVISEGYHGHHDLFTSLTQPALGVVDQFSIMRADAVTFKTGPACIIDEPVKLVWEKPKEYDLEASVLRIFDEVITGFRVPKYCVANAFALTPDIIILGKALANGLPLSVVAGREDIMDCGEYFISSTFSGEAIALAAAKATLEELMENKNLQDLTYYGDALRAKLNDLHPDIKFEGYGTRAMLNTSNHTTALFMQEMCKAGVLFGKAWFYHFGHMEEEGLNDIVLSAAEQVVMRIKRGNVKLEGKIPVETFKR